MTTKIPKTGKKKNTCVVCCKDTLVASGWHLKYGLDFCSSNCLAKFVEILYGDVWKCLNQHEKRIRRLEHG